MADLGDYYNTPTATAPPVSQNGRGSFQASVSGSQSGSASVSAEGAPVVWLLALAALAFVLMHTE